MRAITMDTEIEEIGAGHRRARQDCDLAESEIGRGGQADALAARTLALDDTDHTGAAETAMDFDAPALQLVSDDAGGADLLEPDLRMGVEVAADGGEFVGIAVDAVNGGHVSCPVSVMG